MFCQQRLTGVDLPDLRQRQFDFIPICGWIFELYRIRLKIYSIEMLLVRELFFYLLN